MRTRQIVEHAAWLWLPVLLGLCVCLGFYRSHLDPASSSSTGTSCPDSSHLDRFLGCP
jgi:hypothetical protein